MSSVSVAIVKTATRKPMQWNDAEVRAASRHLRGHFMVIIFISRKVSNSFSMTRVRQMFHWCLCGGRVFVKPYNINEYNIFRLINNPVSLALREAYYPPARTDVFSFVIHLDCWDVSYRDELCVSEGNFLGERGYVFILSVFEQM